MLALYDLWCRKLAILCEEPVILIPEERAIMSHMGCRSKMEHSCARPIAVPLDFSAMSEDRELNLILEPYLTE